MLYALIIIFTGQYVSTTNTIYFQNEQLCQSAKAQIVSDYEAEYGAYQKRAPKLTAHCVPVNE